MTDLEQIKERIDIVELIQGYIRLQKAGMNYKAVCPFHNEKTPSFMVSPSRQIWHCFGCSKGGDAFRFVMEIEGVEFSEALQTLAKRAGVELKNFSKDAVSGKNKLYEVSELAAKFFEKQLWDSENGKKAAKYLKERGLEEEIIKKWRLGYAPNTWNSLRSFLKNSGYSEKEIFASGLSVKKDEVNYYDRFRGRIMFPICDINSRIIGFTGRVFEEVTGEIEAGKYINTPQTLIYDKSNVIYGLDKAKIDIRKKDKALVVEGNMDVIMSHQAGIQNAIASSGTALTGQHLKILRRYTQNLDLCFDDDSAGEIAAKRGIDLALSLGFNVGVLSLGMEVNPERSREGPQRASVSYGIKDPADMIKESPLKWQEVSQKSQPIVKFYLDKAFQKYDIKTALGKKNVANEVLPIIKIIDNKIEQDHWTQELAGRLKVDQKVVAKAMDEMKVLGFNQADGPKYDFVRFETPQHQVLEETLLALLFKMPTKANEISFSSDEELEIFQDKLYNDFYQRLKSGDSIKGPFSYEDNLRLELIKFKSDQFFGGLEEKDLENEISRLIKSLKKEFILDKIKDLELEIKGTKDKKEIPPLLQKVKKFSNKLSSL